MTCGHPIYWWDGEYDMNCILPINHEGDHFDGLTWYDDEQNDKSENHEHERP